MRSREIHLVSRPAGEPGPENFRLVAADIPAPREGEVLVKNLWMSVDPYMRGRMNEGASYVEAFQLGEAMGGGAVGEVIESRNANFKAGDHVLSFNGWREGFIDDGAGLQTLDTTLVPPQAYLGVAGMPGLTAYVGLHVIGGLKPDDTVFVSAASGAVGSVACQLAKLEGCRVVGTAGSDEKTAWLREECGVDAAINYKTVTSLSDALAQACPDGIDLCFENVGGPHLEAALDRMNEFGRIALCGMIHFYNQPTLPAGPSNFFLTLTRRLRVQGFIVSDHQDQQPRFIETIGAALRAGKLRWRETVYEGIEQAPDALLGLFSGKNIGKMLVKLG